MNIRARTLAALSAAALLTALTACGQLEETLASTNPTPSPVPASTAPAEPSDTPTPIVESEAPATPEEETQVVGTEALGYVEDSYTLTPPEDLEVS